MRKRDMAKALADYDVQIKLKPDLLAFINRGNVYRDTEKLDRAAADYGEAARIAPTDARGWRNRGMIRLFQGDSKGGLADYDKALQCDPSDAYSWNNRGQARMRLGDLIGSHSSGRLRNTIQPPARRPWASQGAAIGHDRTASIGRTSSIRNPADRRSRESSRQVKRWTSIPATPR